MSLPSIGAAGGVIILWNKDSINEVASRVDRFSTSLTAIRHGVSLHRCISAVYGPSDGNLFPVFLEELEMIRSSSNLPWCIGRDFNEVLFSKEMSNGGRRTRGMERFGDFVDKNNLLDVPCSGPRFTWSNFQERPMMSRLIGFWCLQIGRISFRGLKFVLCHALGQTILLYYCQEVLFAKDHFLFAFS